MKLSNFRTILSFGLLLFLGFSLSAEASSTPVIEITPSRYELLVEPRGQSVQSMKISNLGSEEMSFTAVTHDWDMSPDGSLLLLDSGSTSQSASNWIRFNPKKFTIGGSQSQFIRFSVSVPPNVQPGEYRTALVLTPETRLEMKKGLYVQPTFAILVYVNVPEIRRNGEMQEVKITVDESSTYFLEGQIRSKGNAHLRLTGEYFLINEEGREIQNQQIGKILILPGRTDSFKISLGKNLTPGKYKVKLIWHYLPAFYMEGKLDEYSVTEQGMVKEFAFTI